MQERPDPALRFIRMSGGALAGERRARLGFALGIVGTLELVLPFILVAQVPSRQRSPPPPRAPS